MSQTADSLEKNIPDANSEPVQSGSVWSRFSVILWLAASITATVFSFQMGLRQGQQEAAESVSPKQWLYYFSENDEAEEETPAEEVPAQAPAKVEAPKNSKETVAVKPAASPMPKPKVSAMPAVKRSGFAIQLVTYENQALAQQEAERISKKGHDAFVVPSGKYFLVYLNLSKDRKTAMQKLAQLNKAGFTKVYPGAYVRTVGKKKSGQS